MFNRQTRLLIAVAAGMSSAAVCHAEIDFSPRYGDIMWDGVWMNVLYLQDGAQRIFLDKPPEWDLKAEGGGLCLTSLNHRSARVDLRNSSVKLPPTPDQKWIKAMTPELIKSLPEKTKNAMVVDTIANPFALYNWKSFEFRLAYELEGIKYLRSVCFLTVYGKGSIEMVTGSLEQDFAPAREMGLTMLSSWNEPPVGMLKRMVK